MKNVAIFDQIRLRAMLDDEHYRTQRAICKEYETAAYKMWRSYPDKQMYEDEFHRACEETRKYERLIEQNEPFTKEKWYMTNYLYTDAHAYEVVEVYSRDKMDVRRLNATEMPEAREKRLASFVPGGFCGTFDNSEQEWSFESDEKNPILTVRRHKDGKYYLPNTRTSPFVPQTEPYEWYDFNF